MAAATRNAGNEVALLNLMFEGDPMLSIRNSIEDFRPDVIGISVRNIDDQNMLRPQFLLAPVREVIASCRACPPLRLSLAVPVTASSPRARCVIWAQTWEFKAKVRLFSPSSWIE